MKYAYVFDILAIIVISGVIGLVLAVIATTIYDAGYFVNALANMDISIAEVRIIIIVLCLIIGIIIAAIKG